MARCVIEVPANVAFRMEMLDANARRITPDPGRVAAGDPGRGRVLQWLPSAGQHPAPDLARAAEPVRTAAWPRGCHRRARLPRHYFRRQSKPSSPNQGETMAQARMRVSCASDTPPCAQMVPSVDVLYIDVWTDTGAGHPRHADQPALLTMPTAQFMTALPDQRACVDRLGCELPHHHQLPRAPAAAVGPEAPGHRPDHRAP